MIGQPQPLFVLDANVFITAHRSYYAFNLCPGFWECLVHFCRQQRLLSIDRVRNELVSYGDELSDWGENAPDELFASSLESQITEAYREVMSWVYGNPQFLRAAKDEFSQGADGWLVAYAKAYNGTLVTLETYQQDVKRRVPLPNVCEQFGVARMNTFEMLGELGVSFDWNRPG